LGHTQASTAHAAAPRPGASPAPNLPGLLLARLSVLPAVLAAAYLAVALPLLCAGLLRPWLAIPCFVLVAVPAGVFAWRRTPGMSAPTWALVATLVLAVGFGVLAVLTHSEYLFVRRDAGAYSQIGYWLARHGRIPIPGQAAAFGGPDPLLRFASAAFYADGNSVVPQFMSGWPMVLAAGYWLHGWAGLLIMPGLVGCLAVLAIGGLAARLVGPRWAPLAVLVTAVCWPVLHFSQVTYSEPLALLLLFGGLAMIVDVIAPRGQARLGPMPTGRWPDGAGLLAGAVVGLSLLVRIDAGRELTLLVPVVGWLYVRRRPEATPIAIGLAAGTLLGVVDAAVLTRPYIAQLAGSVIPLAGLLAVTISVTVTVVLLLRTRAAPIGAASWWRPLPRLGAALVVLCGLLLAIRPWLQTVRDPGEDRDLIDYVASIQRGNAQPVDGTRTYAEASLHWVAWYLGWPLLILTLLAAAVLTHRALSGREARWVPPLVVILGSTVLTLYRPGITPDHPWADRRLVPVVLPGVILLAVWGLAFVARRAALWVSTLAARRGQGSARLGWLRSGRLARVLVAVLGLVAFTVPATATAAPLVTHRTEVGELGALRLACAAFRPGDVVLLLNGQTEWMQVLRSVCGVPTATIAASPQSSQSDPPTPQQIDYLVARIRHAGGTPVLAVGNSIDPITAYGAQPIEVLRLQTTEDAQTLAGAPTGDQPLQLDLWIARL
jgi:hypothetical protein